MCCCLHYVWMYVHMYVRIIQSRWDWILNWCADVDREIKAYFKFFFLHFHRFCFCFLLLAFSFSPFALLHAYIISVFDFRFFFFLGCPTRQVDIRYSTIGWNPTARSNLKFVTNTIMCTKDSILNIQHIHCLQFFGSSMRKVNLRFDKNALM